MPGWEIAMTAALTPAWCRCGSVRLLRLGTATAFASTRCLDELDGDRYLVIGAGHAEAFALEASLQGLQWGRPMTYQFTAALVRSLGGRVREIRLDWIVKGAYAASVEVDGRRAWGWWMPGPAMR